MKRFSKNQLRSAREEAGLTQQELADRIGVVAGTVSNWENGYTEPGSGARLALAKALPQLGDATPTSRNLGLPARRGADFAAWLRRARADAEMTLEELADESGLSTQTIWSIENGRAGNPRESTVAQLEQALGVTTARPVGRSGGARSGLGEEDFYAPFSEWLKSNGGCQIAFPVGGKMFGDKWGTPDVVGFAWGPGHDTRDRPDIVVAAEIKLDDRNVLAACAQACCYTVFSHRNYVVVPMNTDENDLARARALCMTLGIGLVVYDSGSPEAPAFEMRVAPTTLKPDYTYELKYVSNLQDQLRRELDAQAGRGGLR